MHALVFDGPGRRAWREMPDPMIQDPTDAIVAVDTTTICGTDLHILKGDVPEVAPGRVLGHEAVGVVEAIGSAVTSLQPGDRVLLSCISACGRCRYCREAMYGQCLGGGGWILGHLIDGTQAEYVRVPFADTSAYRLPAGASGEQAVMLSDILPTSYEVGVLKGGIRPADVVVIVGAGPIGLAAAMTARLFGPLHVIVADVAEARLEMAKHFGADVVINTATEDVRGRIDALSEGLGADVAIEAVGVPETFELCTRLIRPGGHVANIGVHGKPATLALESLWIKNVTITTGLVDTFSTPKLLGLLRAGHLDTSAFATHRFALADIEAAYDTFADAATSGALKVVLS
ncbi:MAG TPA: zinc-dependent alcohol dehydrogenase family protein [Mycobacteriales bacterium]|nr:zinc-dependent alcohol dehydrogenase family protein [Mycobacteriales bacterium]